MDWERLDREKSHSIIGRVTTASDGTLFTTTSSEVSCKSLPFYKNFLLYRITNYATLPSFSLHFLGDGNTFYMVDGSPDPIFMVNNRGDLQLNERNILAYVDFFLSNVSTDDGDIYLIRDPDSLPFLDSMSIEQQVAMKQRFSPLDVSYCPQSDQYKIRCDLYYGGTLLKSTLSVGIDGSITFSDQTLLSQPQQTTHHGGASDEWH